MVLPDKGRNEVKLENIAQDQSLSALLNGQDTGIRALFPANSLASDITVYLDAYADDKISDVAGALATGQNSCLGNCESQSRRHVLSQTSDSDAAHSAWTGACSRQRVQDQLLR
jgi:hypothetical protein